MPTDLSMATLVTVPNVELVETGVDWPASTGPVTFTSDDLISAAQAPYNDPMVKLPRLIFGHTAAGTTWPESMGAINSQPAVGKFTNLRVVNDGNLLMADITGVPKWLADILPTAYPSRSVEAFFEVTTNSNKHHRMIIPSVALLGEELPGVQSLEDLQYLFSEEPQDWINALTVEGQKVAASQTQPGGGRTPTRVAASVDTGDVRSAFYEQVAVDDRYWWWLHQCYIDPAVVIAEDEDMEYWLVPYSTADAGVTFADPVKVFMQWVEEDSGQVAASSTAKGRVKLPGIAQAAQTWASAEDSRPSDRQGEFNKKEAKAAVAIDINALRVAAGLSEEDLPNDATEEQINAALAAKSESGETKDDDEVEKDEIEDDEEGDDEEEDGEKASTDYVKVHKDTWHETRAGAKAGLDLAAKAARAENEQFLDSLVTKGTIPPSAKGSYLKQMNGPKNDGNGPAKAEIKTHLESLEPGVVPIEERGHSGGEDNTNTNKAASRGTGLFPKLEASRRSREEANA